jgi:N-acetylmuramate 1-kinase
MLSPHLPGTAPTFDLAAVTTSLQAYLPFSSEPDDVQALPGDASNRRYFRVHLNNAPVTSMILMQLADPEGFKASEEAVSGHESGIAELPFLNILRHLKEKGVSVPTVYGYDEGAGLIYLEDLGDRTLAQVIQGAPLPMLERWYRQAIDQLIHLHLSASVPSSQPCWAFSRSFDEGLFMWEFDHFLEYGIVARHGRPMCAEDSEPIREEFRKMAVWLAAQPTVFTHRDFHSRNLMVSGERLGIIDFQDALLGPVTYDVASLLRDSYIVLEEPLIDELIVRLATSNQSGNIIIINLDGSLKCLQKNEMYCLLCLVINISG